MGRLELDVAHLSAGELDDQALAEISVLLSSTSGQIAPPASSLIGVASAGELVVARRPCGAEPEIVGVAARIQIDGSNEVVVAVSAATCVSGLAADLRGRLEASPVASSLFRRRHRAPLGL